MLVHFPAAMFPADLLLAYLYKITGTPSMTMASFYFLEAGVLFGWLAAVAGFLDLIPLGEHNPRAFKKAFIHGSIQVVVLISYTWLAFLKFKEYPSVNPDLNSIIGLKTGLVMLLIFGNFIGGELILRDKVAVRNP